MSDFIWSLDILAALHYLNKRERTRLNTMQQLNTLCLVLVVCVLTVGFGFLWRFNVEVFSQRRIERRAGSIHCTPGTWIQNNFTQSRY